MRRPLLKPVASHSLVAFPSICPGCPHAGETNAATRQAVAATAYRIALMIDPPSSAMQSPFDTDNNPTARLKPDRPDADATTDADSSSTFGAPPAPFPCATPPFAGTSSLMPLLRRPHETGSRVRDPHLEGTTPNPAAVDQEGGALSNGIVQGVSGKKMDKVGRVDRMYMTEGGKAGGKWLQMAWGWRGKKTVARGADR